MPYEFALRQRIRLREGFEPPRRRRWRGAKVALPVLAYWGVAAAVTYQLLHWHDPKASALPQVVLARPAETGTPWWQVPESALAGVAPGAGFERAPVPSRATTPVIANQAATAAIAEEPAVPEESDPLTVATEPAARAVRDEASHSGEARPELGSALAARDESPRGEPAPHSRASVASESVALPGLFGLSPGDASNRASAAPLILGAVPPDVPAQVASALPSCEAAQARANQAVTIGADPGAADLSREVIARVLDNGVWIARCDIPMTTSVELCVAIQGGQVIGASVTSHPASVAINACVKRRAASLTFPSSKRVDLARTHF